MASIEIDGANGVIKSTVSDSDLTIKGNDGGSEISALAFDMSDAGTATFNHDISLSTDGAIIKIAADNDLQLTHSGSAGDITCSTGALDINAPTLNIKDEAGSEIMASFTSDGTVSLRYDNTEKLLTSSTGINLPVDGDSIKFGANSEVVLTHVHDSGLKITHDGGGDPDLILANTASASDGNQLGSVFFNGQNSNGDEHTYAFIIGQARDVTDGEEDGQLVFYGNKGGSDKQFINYGANANGASPTHEVCINEGSEDIDFRVEGDGNTHALFVRASDDHVGINEAAPDCRFHIKETNNTSFSTDNFTNIDNSILKLENASTTNDAFVNMSFRTGDGMDLFFGGLQDDSDGNKGAFVFGRQAATNVELLRIGGDGDIAAFAGHTPSFSSLSNVGAILYGSSGQIASKGDGSILGASGACIIVNRLDNDGPLVNLLQAGTEEGDIAVSGGTVGFNGFTGTHWSRLADNSRPDILKGTIIESIDEMCDWYQAVDSTGTHKLSVALPEGKNVGDAVTFELEGEEYEGTYQKELDIKHVKSKVSDTADSKKIYGLFNCWDGDDEDGVNDFIVAQVGTFVIRVNKDVTVEAGDLLVSNGDGTAKVQDDDIIRSKTVAKVNSNVKVETYSDGSYTVPCTLHC